MTEYGDFMSFSTVFLVAGVVLSGGGLCNLLPVPWRPINSDNTRAKVAGAG